MKALQTQSYPLLPVCGHSMYGIACLWPGIDSFGPPTLPLLVTGNSISRRKGTKLVYVWLCIIVCMGSRAVSRLVEVQ